MLLDPGMLLAGEGAGLVQDVVGSPDLADVVEVGALGKGTQHRGPQPLSQTDADRKVGHQRGAHRVGGEHRFYEVSRRGSCSGGPKRSWTTWSPSHIRSAGRVLRGVAAARWP